MSDKRALKIAIDLMHLPSQVRLIRSQPLPDGMPMLLRIAAGDIDAQQRAVELTDRLPAVVRRAATFFIEQILFAPEADSYRVLGTTPEANATELRRNLALLLRWLHPDLDTGGERSVFVSRVTTAWNNLKTQERRAAYDALRLHSHTGTNIRTSTRRDVRRRLFSALPRQNESGGDPSLAYPGVKVGLLRRALSIFIDRCTMRVRATQGCIEQSLAEKRKNRGHASSS